MSKVKLFVEGMHCASCKIYVEENISQHKDVKKITADLQSQMISIEIEREDVDQLVIDELNGLLSESNYKIHREKKLHPQVNKKDLVIGFLIAMAFVFGFLTLQRFGLVNLLNAESISLPFVFFIGVVASLSTCMAVVGGLVLSISGTYAKEEGEKSSKKIILFHFSRILSFFIFGGIIGLLGSAFILTPITSFILNLILFVVMLIMGINLLDIFPIFRKLQFRFPRLKDLDIVKKYNSALILLGASTFFLPCGFTQSMQVYSLSTGSFINGALTMLIFSLGTLPILSMITFASLKLSKTFESGLFFKTSGFIVIAFAILNFLGALVAIGYIDPLFSI